uniref:Uncharacterized protein n=1 Tax=uncultured marine virus TaxID=186617 RepID=S4TE57_9VIRU|nr:hypothetical protein [uncultured marine virus]
MPKGLKETSSLIVISAFAAESAPATFSSVRVDLQLNPLDNEVFVVYGIDIDASQPALVPGTTTQTNASISTTQRTTVGGINQSNVMAAQKITTQEVGGAAVTNMFSSDSAPSTQLEYLGILATNDFFVNVESLNNPVSMAANVRLYGVRARADASIYSALVQSELLS